MKKSLLSSAAVIAFAAHLTVATPATAQQAVPDVVGIFQGFYVGGHGIYGGVQFDSVLDGTDTPVGLGSAHGGGGGVHVGYNHVLESGLGMFDGVLAGIEGDLTFMDWDDSTTVGALSADAELNLLSSVRFRMGVVHSGVLFFATGGVAFADWDYSVFDAGTTSPNFAGSRSYFDVGAVVGGGVEFPILDFAIVRVEGLYYLFGNDHDTSGLIGTSDPPDFAEVEHAYAVRGAISIPLNNLFGAFN